MKKYYWRKKEEYLVWFEEDIYLRAKPLHLTPVDKSPYLLAEKSISGKSKQSMLFSEEEARNILKDDFEKFEREGI